MGKRRLVFLVLGPDAACSTSTAAEITPFGFCRIPNTKRVLVYFTIATWLSYSSNGGISARLGVYNAQQVCNWDVIVAERMPRKSAAT